MNAPLGKADNDSESEGCEGYAAPSLVGTSCVNPSIFIICKEQTLR